MNGLPELFYRMMQMQRNIYGYIPLLKIPFYYGEVLFLLTLAS